MLCVPSLQRLRRDAGARPYLSKAAAHRSKWIVDFLKNPQTLRPTLTFRMPQFNMPTEEATVLADYLSMVMQTPAVNLAGRTLRRSRRKWPAWANNFTR